MFFNLNLGKFYKCRNYIWQGMIHIERIVPKNLVNELKLQKFQVGFIEAKHANKAIQVLKGLQTLPIDSFFLKRVRKNKQPTNHTVYVEVLLCLSEQKEQFMKEISEAFKQAFGQQILKQVVTMQLPRYAPPSKKDFQQWTKYWPCNFIEPQFTKKIPHTIQQKVIIQQLSKVSQAKQQTHNSYYLFSANKYLTHFEGPKQSFSCHSQNPLEHPIMQIAEKWPETEVYKKAEKEYYYFTGLRMIVCCDGLCGMCAMALVHSRVERVYFCDGLVPEEEILEVMYNMRLNHKIDLLKMAEGENGNKIV